MRILIILISVFYSVISLSQTEAEIEVVEIINQVRKSPQVFLKNVAKPYIEENNLSRNRYAKSLVRELEKLDSMQPLEFENSLQKMSEEFAEEAGKRGWVGHRKTSQRFKKNASHIDITAENLQYGYDNALDIVMDLLIDFDIPDLGHRKNILNPVFSVIGVSINEHKSYEFITVMSFGGFK